MTSFEQFSKRQYLNIETFRKSGLGVRTPVWFVQDGDILYVHTEANSGKVKRIHNNGQVNIAPCKMDGALLGDWLPAIAREVKDKDIYSKVDRMLNKKYGLMKLVFGIGSIFRKRNDAILEIKARE